MYQAEMALLRRLRQINNGRLVIFNYKRKRKYCDFKVVVKLHTHAYSLSHLAH